LSICLQRSSITLKTVELTGITINATTTLHDGKRKNGAAAQQIRFKLSNADDGFSRTVLETFDLMKFIPGQQR